MRPSKHDFEMANICKDKVQYSEQNNEQINECSGVQDKVQHSEQNIEQTDKSSEVEHTVQHSEQNIEQNIRLTCLGVEDRVQYWQARWATGQSQWHSEKPHQYLVKVQFLDFLQ